MCLCFSSANKCLLKVGHYSAQLEQYPKAIEIYEQVLPVSAMWRQSRIIAFPSKVFSDGPFSDAKLFDYTILKKVFSSPNDVIQMLLKFLELHIIFLFVFRLL